MPSNLFASFLFLKPKPLYRGMEAGGGRQSRLSRLLNRLRGDHHTRKHTYTAQPQLRQTYALTNTVVFHSSCIGVDSKTNRLEDEESVEVATDDHLLCEEATTSTVDDHQFRANIDLRYGGQYLTPEQLPEFCDQLHQLVAMIRNIQSYATVTGEYPSSLERRLAAEAREVAALAAETRNARDVVARTRTQRRAVRAQRRHLVAHLTSLRDTEMRELESTVRLSDRKLFKSWEVLKDASDAAAFEPLLEEIRNKQTALECLVRLIEIRRSAILRSNAAPHPLPLPAISNDREETNATIRRRHTEAARRGGKRRRGARSVPLSEEPSMHTNSATKLYDIFRHFTKSWQKFTSH